MAAMTRLTAIGPATAYPYLYPKNVATPGIYGQRVTDFDTWKALYGGVIVYIRRAGSTELADVYSDPGLTIPAANPQTLLSRNLLGVAYGKFLAPIYTPDAFYCDIDSTDQTGVQQPAIYDLDGQDGDRIVVTAQGGRHDRSLEDHLARIVYVEDYGAIGTSPSENTRTITAAIGQAGARGGGIVMLPPGSIDILSLTMPTAVYLAGYARGATTLRSSLATAIITFTGANCGLVDLTLDGVSAIAGSTGLLSEQQDDILLRNVTIKRFETGLHVKGGARPRFDRLSLTNHQFGARLQGDTEALSSLWWSGGIVAENVEAGIWIEYVDQIATHLKLEEIEFRDNLMDGLLIDGGKFITVDDCRFDDNARTIKIVDDAMDDAGFCESITFRRGYVANCTIYVDGLAIDVMFDRCEFVGTEFQMVPTMGKHLVLRDCSEDAAVRIIGDGTRLMRRQASRGGSLVGSTTDATPVKGFAYNLEPGETAVLLAKAVANGVDNEIHAVYVIAQGARRDTADLDFDTGTIAFNVGELVEGGTSGASAYITAKSGTTGAGTLSLRSIVGTFQNNEALQVDGVTRALVNGTINDPAVSMLGSLSVVHTFESDTTMACVFVASGDEAQVQVTGVAAKTIEWTIDCDRLSG